MKRKEMPRYKKVETTSTKRLILVSDVDWNNGQVFEILINFDWGEGGKAYCYLK